MLHRRAFHVAVGLALFQILAPIEPLPAFADGQRDLHLPVLPEKRERHERVAFHRCQFEQLPDF